MVSKHWAHGGAGAEVLAHKVVNIVDQRKPEFTYVYDENLSLWKKIEAIATKLYGAGGHRQCQSKSPIRRLGCRLRKIPDLHGKNANVVFYKPQC